jgi:hypothetical protein
MGETGECPLPTDGAPHPTSNLDTICAMGAYPPSNPTAAANGETGDRRRPNQCSSASIDDTRRVTRGQCSRADTRAAARARHTDLG